MRTPHVLATPTRGEKRAGTPLPTAKIIALLNNCMTNHSLEPVVRRARHQQRHDTIALEAVLRDDLHNAQVVGADLDLEVYLTPRFRQRLRVTEVRDGLLIGFQLHRVSLDAPREPHGKIVLRIGTILTSERLI